MSIAFDYLNALKAWIALEAIAAPPASGVLGLVQVGVFKGDPTATPAVLTLHLGDPNNDKHLARERIADQMSARDADVRHQVIGGPREIGGGDHYWYHFTARLQNYMTSSGLTQIQANEQNDELVRWVEDVILAAQPWALGVTTSGNETMTEIVYEDATTLELGGPPTSWIWHTSIHFKGLVHRE